MSKNLALRLAVSAIGIPTLIYICIKGDYYLLAFSLLLTGLGSLELVTMLRNRGYGINRFLSVLFPILCVIAAFYEFPVLYVIAVSLLILSLSLFREQSVERLMVTMFSRLLPVLYLGLLVSFVVFTAALPDYGGRLLIFIFLTVWATDTAAFVGGRAFGKRKLSPQLSPNKTMEGFYSGFMGALLAAVVSQVFFLKIGWSKILAMSILACFFGQLGDLFESGIKRHCRVKDSSAIIPGHGGVLDRFDSFLFAVPTVYLIFVVWK